MTAATRLETALYEAAEALMEVVGLAANPVALPEYPDIDARTWYQAQCQACGESADLDGMEWQTTPEAAFEVARDAGGLRRARDGRLLCRDCEADA